MTIPVFDARREYEALAGELDAAALRVLRSGRYIMGPEVEAFEREVAEYVGVPHAVSVGNGTDALLLALRAAGLGQGHTVLTTPFTFAATIGAILNAGGTARLVDIDPETFNV